MQAVADKVFAFLFQKPEAQRLDHFLMEALPDYSRARLQAFIKGGQVRVDGKPAAKSGAKLESGSSVEVKIPPTAPSGLIAENIPLDIVFENQDVVVINKPAGMVVHPAAGHQSGTLVHAILGHDPDIEGIGGEERPGVVHRLDKDTSGLILLAKNDQAHHWLQDQFRLRKVQKTYIALVDGKPPTPAGRVEAAIGRDFQPAKTNGNRSGGEGTRGRQRVPNAGIFSQAHAAGISPAHRTHPSNPAALCIPRLPDRGGPRLRLKETLAGYQQAFSARRKVENHTAG